MPNKNTKYTICIQLPQDLAAKVDRESIKCQTAKVDILRMGASVLLDYIEMRRQGYDIIQFENSKTKAVKRKQYMFPFKID